MVLTPDTFPCCARLRLEWVAARPLFDSSRPTSDTVSVFGSPFERVGGRNDCHHNYGGRRSTRETVLQTEEPRRYYTFFSSARRYADCVRRRSYIDEKKNQAQLARVDVNDQTCNFVEVDEPVDKSAFKVSA